MSIIRYAGGFGSWKIKMFILYLESRSQNFMARILSLLYCKQVLLHKFASRLVKE